MAKQKMVGLRWHFSCGQNRQKCAFFMARKRLGNTQTERSVDEEALRARIACRGRRSKTPESSERFRLSFCILDSQLVTAAS